MTLGGKFKASISFLLAFWRKGFIVVAEKEKKQKKKREKKKKEKKRVSCVDSHFFFRDPQPFCHFAVGKI